MWVAAPRERRALALSLRASRRQCHLHALSLGRDGLALGEAQRRERGLTPQRRRLPARHALRHTVPNVIWNKSLGPRVTP
jgi:hypothetical protein